MTPERDVIVKESSTVKHMENVHFKTFVRCSLIPVLISRLTLYVKSSLLALKTQDLLVFFPSLTVWQAVTLNIVLMRNPVENLCCMSSGLKFPECIVAIGVTAETSELRDDEHAGLSMEAGLFEPVVQMRRRERRTDKSTKAPLHQCIQVEVKQGINPTGSLSVG